MTEDEVNRADLLIFAREEIEEFLDCRDPSSEIVKSYLESKYDHQVREGKRLPKSEVVELTIRDADDPRNMDGDCDHLHYVHVPRTLVEAGMRAQLTVIAAELESLNVWRYSEAECPGHVAAVTDAKRCGRCGTHVDSLR